jgi:DNA topoisomerase-1
MSLVPVPDLRYVTDEEPGLRRRRAGKSFRVLRADGSAVRDAAVLERVRSLAIPPAWTDVWICASPDGHLQATGRDARGRKQYRYHPEWRAFRDRVKFSKLSQFGAALPSIRRQVERDLRGSALTRERVLATVVWLLERTMVRVGNEEYAQANNSYGLTTLRNRHAKPTPRGVRLVFRGKSGKTHEVELSDRRITRVVRDCHELPGALLFEYIDADGLCRPVQSNDVNDYIRAAADMDATAKDFRTWHATCYAAALFADLPAPGSEREAQSGVKQVATIVSESLRNTPAVCRTSYMHPIVVDRYVDGTLPELWPSAAPTAPRGLDADERRLLALLRGKRRARSSDAPAARAAKAS